MERASRVRGVCALGVVMFLIATGQALAAGTFYVDNSTSCSDGGPGSATTPYCTISKAVDVRGGPGTTILVRPGIYREQVEIAASGSSSNPFVIQASGSPVTVDAADSLESAAFWTRCSGSSNVYSTARVTWTPLQVFADGARLTASSSSACSIPVNTYRYVSGTGLYVNLGGDNPGNRATLAGRRDHGFRLSGRTWVTLDGFIVTHMQDRGIYLSSSSNDTIIRNMTVTFANKYGIAVAGSARVLVSGNTVSDNNDHGIFLSGGTTASTVQDNESFRNARPAVRAANGVQLNASFSNLILRNRFHDNQDTGEHFGTGSNNNISVQNRSWNNGDHGFDHIGSSGTLHVGDVAWHNFKDGFSIEGNSPGTRVYDCIATDNGLTTDEFNLWVDSGSTSGFSSNYNIFWNSTSQAPIKYISTKYATITAFTAATGRDAQSVQLDPRFVNPAAGDFHLQSTSPAIDSADSSVPSWPATDAEGKVRVDVPSKPNTGAGPVPYADRGALEAGVPNLAPNGAIDLPVGNVTVTPGQSVTFAGTGSDPDGNLPLTYRWDFGGGAPTATVEDPGPVAFGLPGMYTVTFTVTDALGLADPTPATRVVRVNAAPNGTLDQPAGNVTVAAGQSVTFAGTGSDPDGDLPLTFHWNFGGGAPAMTVEDPGAVTFGAPGTYTVTFTVTDALGLADPTPATRVVRVNGAPNGTIDSPGDDLTIASGGSVTFEGTGTDPEGNPLTYDWDFGGGAPEQSVEDPGPVEFDAPGVFTVIFTVTDDAGVPDPTPASRTITVEGAAIVTDEIHWTITGPTSVTVHWRGTASMIHYGLTPAYGQVAAGQNPVPVPFSSSGPFFEARLEGLQADTLYHYAVGGGGPDHTFRTPPPAGTGGFTVFVEGDVSESSDSPAMAGNQAIIAAGQPLFTLVVGDLSYGNAHGQSRVDQHFNDVMVWSRDAAYMPAWGNHEWDDPTNAACATPNLCSALCSTPATACDDLRNYKGRFDLPNPHASPGSPDADGEDWYWFDAGNVRFIAYPELYPGAWADWAPQADALMDAADADPDIRYIVTFGHRPAYSSGHHPGSPALKGYLDGLASTHPKYLLNLNGHSHNYERTLPMGGSQPGQGVVHLTVGTGGFSLEGDGTCHWDMPCGGTCPCPPPAYSFYRAMHHGTLRLHFGDTGIEGAFLCGPAGFGPTDITCAPGEVIDSFSLPPAAPVGVIDEPLSDVTIRVGQSVSFAGTGTDAGGHLPLSFAWNFGGGASNSTVEDPGAVRFDAPGTFTVTFTVRNALGLPDPEPQTRHVTVLSDLAPNGTIDSPAPNALVVAGQSQTFTGTGADPDGHLPLTFLWHFGGGAPDSSVEDPGPVTLGAPGTYIVTFTVTDALGLSDPSPATLTIRVDAPPNGTIDTPSADVTIVAGRSVTFAGTANDPDGDVPLGFQWSFGGGAPSQSVEDPGAVSFGTPGSYTVQFTVTDSLGVSDPSPAARHVTVVPNTPPTASLGVTPSSGTAPLTVQADGSASADTDGVVTSYTFDFGDGTVLGPQPGPQASHIFAAGTWTVRLTVTDDLGGSGQTTATVTVVPSDGGVNLVGNPSFETNTTGWTAYSGATILRVAGGFDGAFSLRIIGPGALGTFGLNDSPNWVASTPGSGTRYRITAWVRSDAPAGRVKLKTREYSQSVQVGPTNYSPLLTLSPAWQSITFDVVTQGPSGSTLDFQILDDAPLAPGEVFYVDNISIRIAP